MDQLKKIHKALRQAVLTIEAANKAAARIKWNLPSRPLNSHITGFALLGDNANSEIVKMDSNGKIIITTTQKMEYMERPTTKADKTPNTPTGSTGI